MHLYQESHGENQQETLSRDAKHALGLLDIQETIPRAIGAAAVEQKNKESGENTDIRQSPGDRVVGVFAEVQSAIDRIGNNKAHKNRDEIREHLEESDR